MSYTPQSWADLPSETTPITAARLGYIESGVQAAAVDSTVMHKAGAETITGAKTLEAELRSASSISANGAFDEETTESGVYIGGPTGFGTPRILLANGNPSQNLQIDNDGGKLRFFIPGNNMLVVDTVAGTVDLNNKRIVYIGDATDPQDAVSLRVARAMLRVGPAPVAVDYAASVALDASLGSLFRITLAGDLTLTAPSNSTDGQEITVELTQDATGSRLLTLDPGYGAWAFGTTLTTAVLTTDAGRTDRLTARYRLSSARWEITDFKKGY